MKNKIQSISMPADVVTMLEKRVEKGQRSEFIVSAIREKFINIYLDEHEIPKAPLKFGSALIKKESKNDKNPIQALIDLPPLADLSPDEIVAFIKEMRDEE